jgi:hypothetical protein
LLHGLRNKRTQDDVIKQYSLTKCHSTSISSTGTWKFALSSLMLLF